VSVQTVHSEVLAIGFNPITSLKNALKDAASSFLDSVGKAFATMAANIAETVFRFAEQKTAISFDRAYFVDNYNVVFGLAILIVTAIFLCACIMGAIRGDTHVFVRAAAGTGTAIMGSFLGLALLQLACAAADGMTDVIASGPAAGATAGSAALGADFVTQLRSLDGNFALALILGSLVALFSFALFLVLFVRKVAVLVIALFLPLYLAGQPAGATSGWMKKAVQALAALIFAKPLIYGIFKVGFAITGEGLGVTDKTLAVFSGLVVMLAAILTPVALMQLFSVADTHVTGLINGTSRRTAGAAASAGHGAGALLGSSSREALRGVGARLQARRTGGATGGGLLAQDTAATFAAAGARRGGAGGLGTVRAAGRPGTAFARVRRAGAAGARPAPTGPTVAAGSGLGGTPATRTRSHATAASARTETVRGVSSPAPAPAPAPASASRAALPAGNGREPVRISRPSVPRDRR
jgi:hypothetical protein